MKEFVFIVLLVVGWSSNNSNRRNMGTTYPEEFDPRNPPASKEIWKTCLPPILDQGQCGSCFAHSTASSFSHRYCIGSGGTEKPDASVEELIGCERYNNACEGGMEYYSYQYIEREGISKSSCMPYSDKYHAMVSGVDPILSCPYDICTGGTDIGTEAKRYYCNVGSTMAFMGTDLGTQSLIKQNIYEYGAMSTGMDTFPDLTDATGTDVYQPAAGQESTGLHAILIIGWGTDHWIVQNSWGSNWGDAGYFKLKYDASDVLVGGSSFCQPTI